MIAVGVVLVLLALAASAITGLAPAPRYDWRDAIAMPPFLVGILLIIAGVIKWLWLVAP